jgi:hypothetical protein
MIDDRSINSNSSAERTNIPHLLLHDDAFMLSVPETLSGDS